MTDVSMAPEQDAIAESLLGDPGEEQTAVETGTETQEFQSEDQPEPVEQIAETEQEQTDDWLPTEQEKVFPDETLLRYAQRYQKDEQWLSDPLNKQLLIDKLNTDIYLQQQQQAEEFQVEEPEPVEEPTLEQPQITREQWFQNLDRVVSETTDPEVAKSFHSDFLRAFGVPEGEIAKVPPQQAMQFTNVASKYMLNLISTHLPNLLQNVLPNQLNQAFPGFGEMHERSAYAMAWDRVRNSNPNYAALPAYGTKEFSQKLHEAESKFPEMLAAFAGPDGKIPAAKAVNAYSLLAKIASGQTVDPALLQQAAERGAVRARQANVKRSAGNLGSGKSKAGAPSNSGRFQSNSDIFDDETMDLYQREHGRL